MTEDGDVRVDRLVKHPSTRRYVRRRSKFMAHNEIEGVSMGDRCRLSKRGRYRRKNAGAWSKW